MINVRFGLKDGYTAVLSVDSLTQASLIVSISDNDNNKHEVISIDETEDAVEECHAIGDKLV